MHRQPIRSRELTSQRSPLSGERSEQHWVAAAMQIARLQVRGAQVCAPLTTSAPQPPQRRRTDKVVAPLAGDADTTFAAFLGAARRQTEQSREPRIPRCGGASMARETMLRARWQEALSNPMLG